MKNHNINVENIFQILKQRFPLLMIDRIVSLEPGKEIVGIQGISNAGIFRGTENWIPLFVYLESMGQLAEILIRVSYPLDHLKGFLAGINHFELITPEIEAGAKLTIKSRLGAALGGVYQTQAVIHLEDQLVAQGTFTHAFR